ncbi:MULTISPECIES: hypothetical protein [unclassified Bradyrhizobium]|uniref:hypothetical protein n=1 Tax=unclassified Bradyrhizobium TaxID=2631580 RepID=UPI001CD468B4|nr:MULTISPECIES: hypothetical protein [unclassified Bradyrhizobium]MCA1378794.1 hypothetical protein [Bradyrhizobium sp. IC4060]MCA1486531.1 hypothetical protein [Bradyrhizobium sp. IC4061]
MATSDDAADKRGLQFFEHERVQRLFQVYTSDFRADVAGERMNGNTARDRCRSISEGRGGLLKS